MPKETTISAGRYRVRGKLQGVMQSNLIGAYQTLVRLPRFTKPRLARRVDKLGKVAKEDIDIYPRRITQRSSMSVRKLNSDSLQIL